MSLNVYILAYQLKMVLNAKTKFQKQKSMILKTIAHYLNFIIFLMNSYKQLYKIKVTRSNTLP